MMLQLRKTVAPLLVLVILGAAGCRFDGSAHPHLYRVAAQDNHIAVAYCPDGQVVVGGYGFLLASHEDQENVYRKVMITGMGPVQKSATHQYGYRADALDIISADWWPLPGDIWQVVAVAICSDEAEGYEFRTASLERSTDLAKTLQLQCPHAGQELVAGGAFTISDTPAHHAHVRLRGVTTFGSTSGAYDSAIEASADSSAPEAPWQLSASIACVSALGKESLQMRWGSVDVATDDHMERTVACGSRGALSVFAVIDETARPGVHLTSVTQNAAVHGGSAAAWDSQTGPGDPWHVQVSAICAPADVVSA